MAQVYTCDKSASGMFINPRFVFTFTRQRWRSTRFSSYLALLLWRSNKRIIPRPPTSFISQIILFKSQYRNESYPESHLFWWTYMIFDRVTFCVPWDLRGGVDRLEPVVLLFFRFRWRGRRRWAFQQKLRIPEYIVLRIQGILLPLLSTHFSTTKGCNVLLK